MSNFSFLSKIPPALGLMHGYIFLIQELLISGENDI